MDLNPSNEELMHSYQQGDFKAFEVLYQRLSGRIYGYLRKRLKERELVDDCFQIIFAKFHKSKSQYDAAYSVEQWVYVIARSTLLDYFRKQKREVLIDPDTLIENVETQMNEAELERDSLDIPLGQLNEQQRQVIQWRVLDEISYEEIAKKLGQTETNVRQIFSRAVKKLRANVPQEGGKL